MKTKIANKMMVGVAMILILVTFSQGKVSHMHLNNGVFYTSSAKHFVRGSQNAYTVSTGEFRDTYARAWALANLERDLSCCYFEDDRIDDHSITWKVRWAYRIRTKLYAYATGGSSWIVTR